MSKAPLVETFAFVVPLYDYGCHPDGEFIYVPTSEKFVEIYSVFVWNKDEHRWLEEDAFEDVDEAMKFASKWNLRELKRYGLKP